MAAEEEEYFVESLLADRYNQKLKRHEWKVKWEGWPIDTATWEPLAHLANNLVFLDYEEKKKRQSQNQVKLQPKKRKRKSSDDDEYKLEENTVRSRKKQKRNPIMLEEPPQLQPHHPNPLEPGFSPPNTNQPMVTTQVSLDLPPRSPDLQPQSEQFQLPTAKPKPTFKSALPSFSDSAAETNPFSISEVLEEEAKLEKIDILNSNFLENNTKPLEEEQYQLPTANPKETFKSVLPIFLDSVANTNPFSLDEVFGEEEENLEKIDISNLNIPILPEPTPIDTIAQPLLTAGNEDQEPLSMISTDLILPIPLVSPLLTLDNFSVPAASLVDIPDAFSLPVASLEAASQQPDMTESIERLRSQIDLSSRQTQACMRLTCTFDDKLDFINTIFYQPFEAQIIVCKLIFSNDTNINVNYEKPPIWWASQDEAQNWQIYYPRSGRALKQDWVSGLDCFDCPVLPVSERSFGDKHFIVGLNLSTKSFIIACESEGSYPAFEIVSLNNEDVQAFMMENTLGGNFNAFTLQYEVDGNLVKEFIQSNVATFLIKYSPYGYDLTERVRQIVSSMCG